MFPVPKNSLSHMRTSFPHIIAPTRNDIKLHVRAYVHMQGWDWSFYIIFHFEYACAITMIARASYTVKEYNHGHTVHTLPVGHLTTKISRTSLVPYRWPTHGRGWGRALTWGRGRWRPFTLGWPLCASCQ